MDAHGALAFIWPLNAYIKCSQKAFTLELKCGVVSSFILNVNVSQGFPIRRSQSTSQSYSAR